MRIIKGSIVSLMILTLLVSSIAVISVNNNLIKNDGVVVEAVERDSDPKPLWA